MRNRLYAIYLVNSILLLVSIFAGCNDLPLNLYLKIEHKELPPSKQMLNVIHLRKVIFDIV